MQTLVRGNDLINIDKLISQLPRYFSNNIMDSWLELVQNSTRAGATYIKLNYDIDNEISPSITVEDDGKGIKDIISSISIANSEWSDNILYTQDPAGMGLFSVFAISDVVIIRSLFGEISINTDLFFSSKEYRLNLINIIDISKKRAGTEIKAILKNYEYLQELDIILSHNTTSHGYYDNRKMYFHIDTYINGDITPKFDIESFKKTNDMDILFEFDYMGNQGFAYINKTRYGYNKSVINYYGHVIHDHLTIAGIKIFLNITTGSSINPKLPERKEIIDTDDSYKKYYSFLEEKIIDYLNQEYDKDKCSNYLTRIRAYNVNSILGCIEYLNRILNGKDIFIYLNSDIVSDHYHEIIRLTDIPNKQIVQIEYILNVITDQEQEVHLTTYSNNHYESSCLSEFLEDKDPNTIYVDKVIPDIFSKHIMRIEYDQPVEDIKNILNFDSIQVKRTKFKVVIINDKKEIAKEIKSNNNDILYFSVSNYKIVLIDTNTDQEALDELKNNLYKIYDALIYESNSSYGDYDNQSDYFISDFNEAVANKYNIINMNDVLYKFNTLIYSIGKNNIKNIIIDMENNLLKFIGKDNSILREIEIRN